MIQHFATRDRSVTATLDTWNGQAEITKSPYRDGDEPQVQRCKDPRGKSGPEAAPHLRLPPDEDTLMSIADTTPTEPRLVLIRKNGHLYRAVPRYAQQKDERGNPQEVREGWKSEGIPLLRVINFNHRPNPAYDLLALHATIVGEDGYEQTG